MNNKNLYLVQLTPLSAYFFGGEKTLGEGDKASYWAKSNRFPSQATLLGVMRYEVLRQRNLLGLKNTERCKACIGPRSFSLDWVLHAHEKIEYGIISRISPLFLHNQRTGDYFTAMPLDTGLLCQWELGRTYLSGKRMERIPVVRDYNTKEYQHHMHYTNPKGESLVDVLKRYCDSESPNLSVFQEVEQIGITKNKKQKQGTDEDAFFKQQMVVLHPDLCFAFTVETFEPLQEGCSMVFMGANRSMFNMQISQPASLPDFFSTGASNYFAPLARPDRYLLLSDAYLSPAIQQATDFIWGESVECRSIQSEVSHGFHWKRPVKSALYHLQAKGSVLYGSKLDEILALPSLQQVGLNMYIKSTK